MKKNSKVLIVDDDPLVTKMIKDILENAGFEVTILNDPRLAVSVAQELCPDIILVDRVMPHLDGCDLCKELSRNHFTSHIPILMLTSRADTVDRIAGLEAGADDYLCKPFDELELIARIRALIRRVQQERCINPLTGLNGNPSVEKEIKQRIFFNEKFAVLYIDIDNFKAYNDTYGFLQADKVIKFLAEIIVKVVRQYGTPDDFLGHIGGDDFIIVTVPDKVDILATKIIALFDNGIKQFYSAEDWERGYVVTLDRKGREQIFPILSISVAVVSNENRKIDNHWKVSEIAAELKKYAKTFPGSIFVEDRRRKD